MFQKRESRIENKNYICSFSLTLPGGKLFLWWHCYNEKLHRPVTLNNHFWHCLLCPPVLKLQRCATMGLQENFGSEDPYKEDGKYLLGMGDLVNQLKRGCDTAAAIPVGVRRAEDALLLRMEPILPNIFSHTTEAKVKYIQQNVCHGK